MDQSVRLFGLSSVDGRYGRHSNLGKRYAIRWKIPGASGVEEGHPRLPRLAVT